MQSFQTVSQEELLDSLIEHYNHYKKIAKSGGTEEEFSDCRGMLAAILEELNYRRQFWMSSKPERFYIFGERAADI